MNSVVNYWTPQRVTDEIKQLHQAGKTLQLGAIKKTNPSLESAAYRKFGSWHKACEMAGIPKEEYFRRPRRISEHWLLDEIRRLANGANDLSGVSASKNHPSVYYIGCNRYRSWYAALKAAGVNPDIYRRVAAEGSWTRPRIISEITELHSRGEDLSYTASQKNHPSLVAATEKRYGSWANGVAAAGFDYESYRRQRPFGYWTKERVTSELKLRFEAGKHMSRVSVGKDSPSLVKYAYDFYGGWFEALDAAGIESGRYRRTVPAGFWSREKIARTIAEMHRSGKDIRPSALAKTHSSLMSAARRKFKRIEEMYFEAGVKPSEIGMLRKWTADGVVTTLRELHSSGKDVKPYKLMHGPYTGLIHAGLREYGSLEAMYKAAGIELGSIGYRRRRSKKYTKEEAISYLLELKDHGEDISPKTLNKNHYGLYHAIRELFGSSWDFYEAAGLSPLQHATLRKRGFWTKERVIEEIISLHENGEDLHLRVIKEYHIPLERAAYKLFGGWHSACEAARIPSEEYRAHFPKGHYTGERVTQQIQQLKENGIDLNGSVISRMDPSLFAAGVSRFGTWYKALEAAGINPNDYRRELSKGYWKKHKIIEEIQTLGSKGADLSYSHAQMEYPSLVSAADKKFGSWSKAVLESGLNYDQYRKQLTALYWTKERMIKKLRELVSSGENIRPSVLRKSYPGIYIWGRKIFGSIEELYRESGIDPNRIGLPRKWTKERVIEEILKRAKEGRSLDFNTIRIEDSGLLSTATRIFKNWFAALDAAGIDSTRIRKKTINGYWTESLIIDGISKMAARGEQLSSGYAQKTHSDLYGGAMKRFGSWGAAVEKSGFDYDSIRKKHKDYSKEELLDLLKELRKDGVSIAFTTVRRINPSIPQSIINRFGSYRKGIESMGLNYDDIRKDGLRECFKGIVFEKYAKRVFESIGWKLRYNKLHKFKEGDCKPDFVDPTDGTWIDAKLDSFCWGVEETIEKYLTHCDKVLIVFLKGKKRIWPDNRVDFIPISDFYMELRGKKEEDIITDLENLRKGILRPELQARLDRYQRKTSQASRMIPSEQSMERAVLL